MKDYVIEYNTLSKCKGKAYSAISIDADLFGKDTFEDMISNKQFEEYYLEQNLEGIRKNHQEVWYDRAWVRSEKTPEEFIQYLENRL